jgi:hypothetical protein
MHVSEEGAWQLTREKGHCSYPSTHCQAGRWYVVPEVCNWSPPVAFPLTRSGIEQPFKLDLPQDVRLLDPTVHCSGDSVYLFGNVTSEGPGVLRLWFADALTSEFTEHPCSPVRLSPLGSRMGGAILQWEGSQLRIGQDFRGSYGDGLALFRIDEISRTSYREVLIGEIKLNSRKGPHTLNITGNIATFDFYDDRFSLLAGLRRFKQSRSA